MVETGLTVRRLADLPTFSLKDTLEGDSVGFLIVDGWDVGHA